MLPDLKQRRHLYTHALRSSAEAAGGTGPIVTLGPRTRRPVPEAPAIRADDSISLAETVTSPPRDILRGAFSVHGIACDPSFLKHCVAELIAVLAER